jgi:hypothetical protein
MKYSFNSEEELQTSAFFQKCLGKSLAFKDRAIRELQNEILAMHDDTLILAQKETKMFNQDFSAKFMERMFKKVENVRWDLMTGKLGVLTNDGITTVDGEGDSAVPTTNMFDQFSMPIPAFAQSTPPEAVKVGNIIISGKGERPAWIIERKEVGDGDQKVIKFTMMRADGTRTHWSPPKVKMLGMDAGGVMVVKPLMDVTAGGTGMGQLQGILQPMLMMQAIGGGQGQLDLERLVPMMLMMQTTSQDGSALTQFGSMMPAFMMMQALGGGGSNPFASMFSGNTNAQTKRLKSYDNDDQRGADHGRW